MDLEKARKVSAMLARRDFIQGVSDEAQTLWAVGRTGRATITVPREWLPSVVELAERELSAVDEEISKLQEYEH